MMSIWRANGIVAAFAIALLGTQAWAQAPADPLAPGAAKMAEEATTDAAAKVEGAKAEAAKSEEAVKPKAKAKAKGKGAAAIIVTVNNKRSVGLVELRVGPAGATEMKKVAGAVAFGRKTTIHLKRTKDCLYDIRAKFADDADSEQNGINLCDDKIVNLTD